MATIACCAVPAADAGAAPVVFRGCLAPHLQGKRVNVAHVAIKLYLPNPRGEPAPRPPRPLAVAVTDGRGCSVLRLTHSPRVAARAVGGRNAFIVLVRGRPFVGDNVSGRAWWIASIARRWTQAGWRPASTAATIVHPIVAPLGLTTAAVIRTLS